MGLRRLQPGGGGRLMGLFVKLALLPLAPVYGVVSLAETLEREAERQLYGEENIQQELFDLQLAYEAGEIDEQEYVDTETWLLTRLEESRRR
jgi:Gas vesicle protein G